MWREAPASRTGAQASSPEGNVWREAPASRTGAQASSSDDNVWREAPASRTSGQADIDAFLAAVRSPLVILGGLRHPGDAEAADRFCRSLGAPVLAEASSGLRRDTFEPLLRSGDAAARRGFDRGVFDSAVRIGDVPSFRVWRDLDLSLPVPVLSVSRTRWRGLTRGTHVQVPPGLPLPLPTHVSRPAAAGVAELITWDRRLSAAAVALLETLPKSEPGMIRRLSTAIPHGSFVYLGNSLPIREWNRLATFEDRGFLMGENRGANGIDGQVASFLGWARRDVENWAVVGDLTALYDLSALWALRHLDGFRLRIVVINNGGGRIFDRMFRSERYQNRHQTGFAAWAAMWGAEYSDALPVGPVGPAAVIELRPSETETGAFWAGLDEEAKR